MLKTTSGSGLLERFSDAKLQVKIGELSLKYY